MRGTGRLLQSSANSLSSVAASELSQPQHQTQIHTASPRNSLSSIFLSCIHLPSLHSSFCHALSFIFSSPISFFLISLLWQCIQFLTYFPHFCPSMVLLTPPHIFACAFPTPTAVFMLFIFSLALFAFTVVAPHTRILSYHIAQMHMVFRSYLASFQGPPIHLGTLDNSGNDTASLLIALAVLPRVHVIRYCPRAGTHLLACLLQRDFLVFPTFHETEWTSA